MNMDKIIFKLLEMELDGTEERKGKYGYIVLKHPGEEYGTIEIEKMSDGRGYVYVFYRLVEKIKVLFSMEGSDAIDVIGRYVGNRYNLRVIHTAEIWLKPRARLGIDTI